jgi:hypothetical protein
MRRSLRSSLRRGTPRAPASAMQNAWPSCSVDEAGASSARTLCDRSVGVAARGSGAEADAAEMTEIR